MKFFYLLLLLPIFSHSQEKIGQDIIAVDYDYLLGDCVSLSSDGNTLAVGNIEDNDIMTPTSAVRIYRNSNDVWTLIGNKIAPQVPNTDYKISLSSDGNTIAIGNTYNGAVSTASAVKIYQNIADNWIQVGNDINHAAYSISLSSDGSIVAVGDFYTNGTFSGVVRIYKNIANVWTQIGNDINRPITGDFFGSSISLSSDGNILAVGASRSDLNGTDSGTVRIYQNIANSWTQIGSDILGETAGDFFGGSLSLSSDGNTLAIGSSNNDANGTDSGHARIYKNIANVWTQIGNDINGDLANEHFGSSVSLSSNGNIVAVSATDNSGFGSRYVRIYKNIANQWIQIGSDINGDSFYGDSYQNVSLSSDGTKVAVGDPDYNGAHGRVQVYNLSSLLNSDTFVASNFFLSPNPVSDILNVNMNETLKLQKVNIYNASGQLLRTEKSNSFKINNLSTGTYFVEVQTNKGKATKKIVVK